MKKCLIFCVLAFAIVACSKDKFETKPTIKFKSASSDIVPLGSALQLTLEYTDKEGDLDSVFIIRQRLNQKGPVTLTNLRYKVPASFKNETKGDIVITLEYSLQLTQLLSPINIPGSGGLRERDTLLMRFVVQDKEKNLSDTAQKNIIVIR